MSSEVVEIKKYSNRRLYDTSKSAYVKLDEVSEIIRGGRQVKVVEAGSGEDVTSYILTQILVEEARKKKFLLPVEFLHLMIRYGGVVADEFSTESFEGVAESFRTMMKVGSDFSDMTRRSMGGMARGFSMFTPPQKKKEDE